MSSYYTGSSHDMYRLQGPFPPRSRHNASNRSLIRENSSSKKGTPSFTRAALPGPSGPSNVLAKAGEQPELRAKRSWSWCESSDFIYFPPFEQAHHQGSADTIRRSHTNHLHTQEIWSPRGGAPQGLTPSLAPTEEKESMRSVTDSEESEGEGSAAQAMRPWWAHILRAVAGWFGGGKG